MGHLAMYGIKVSSEHMVAWLSFENLYVHLNTCTQRSHAAAAGASTSSAITVDEYAYTRAERSGRRAALPPETREHAYDNVDDRRVRVLIDRYHITDNHIHGWL